MFYLISMYIQPNSTLIFTVTSPHHIQRIDTVLPILIPGHSRAFFQKLISAGHVHVNNKVITKSRYELKIDDRINVYFPETSNTHKDSASTDHLDVAVLYEHEQFIIINKPAGLVVHAPHQHSTEVTLVDWLIEAYPDIISVGPIGRAGIVHRLDKNTSGIMIIPRTNYALAQFGTMFKDRTIKKTYHAFVTGSPPETGIIDYPIDRDRTDPTKMTHKYGSGRAAITYYKKMNQFHGYALVEFKPITGRTHQIRVHAAAIGHPLVGDTTYGTSSDLIARHALHAAAIQFSFDNHEYSFTASAPEDFNNLTAHLNELTIL